MNAVSHLLGRLAAAEAQAHARFSATPQQFGPLLAVWAGPESPLSTAWHAGTGLPSAADWQACEDFFAAQGHGCTVHLLSHAAPELLPSLLERGYGLSYVLHAYGHDLQVLPPLGRPQITELPDAEADAWANISARGFGPEAEAVMRQVSRAAGTRRLVAWQAGQPAASAAVSLVNGVAAFFGTSTAPQFRAQGLQAALLAYRLHLAQAAGADCASVFVTPSSGSERNVQRAGFRLAGLRLTFTKPLSPAAF